MFNWICAQVCNISIFQIRTLLRKMTRLQVFPFATLAELNSGHPLARWQPVIVYYNCLCTGKAQAWKSAFLSTRPGRYWRNMQATLVWQLTEFIKGEKYICGTSWVAIRQNGYSVYCLAGTKEFHRVKREGKWSRVLVWECCQEREIPSHAWPGQDKGLFQEPSCSGRHGRSTEFTSNLGSWY